MGGDPGAAATMASLWPISTGAGDVRAGWRSGARLTRAAQDDSACQTTAGISADSFAVKAINARSNNCHGWAAGRHHVLAATRCRSA